MLFARFGQPKKLVFDNGRQFTSKELQYFYTFCGIRQLFSAPYNPSTNGETERFVRSFNDNIKACATQDWRVAVQQLLLS